MSDSNLVTTYNFHGQEYLVKMNEANNCLELIATNKQTGEEWQCCYDITYIENLTHKTGNFKQFDIFVTMLRSGLLKTTECISLDLLTFDDLEALRSRKIRSHTSTRSMANNHTNNRRYLIVTYSVEFDRINYPLPLEYCGLPDPIILQATIRRLETELTKAKEESTCKSSKNVTRQVIILQKRIDGLTEENQQLRLELKQLKVILGTKRKNLFHLSEPVIQNSNILMDTDISYDLVEKLQNDKIRLRKELERVKSSANSLKCQLLRSINQSPSRYSTSNKSQETRNFHNTVPKNKSPVIRPNLVPNYSRRSRSVSPRIVKNKSWNAINVHSLGTRLINTNSPKLRSRSSSATSSRCSPRDAKRYSGKQTKITLTTPKQSRNASPMNLNASGGNSFTSNSSSASRSKLSRSRSRSDTTQYKDLEGKIINLQKILNDNLNIK